MNNLFLGYNQWRENHSMQLLYPDIKPFDIQHLNVETPHRLYIEQSGSEDGIPVIFLHGGPGSGCDPIHRRFFDPEKYRIILFDQRGSGRSEPHANLDNNTTQALVSDMEAIREHLKIKRWLVFGGSWGSTLALVYAQTCPENTLGLILRGTFLARQQDLDWLYQSGASKIYPDYWEDFLQPIPESEQNNLLKAYHHRLIGGDEIARMSAAKAWAIWEGRIATLLGSHKTVEHLSEPRIALALARIETHYFVNQCFLKPNQIIDNAHKLKDIPGVIIHGRYDMICPLENAWKLYKHWPQAELQIIREAGHAITEPAIIDALIRASKNMALRLEQEEGY